VTSEGRGEKVSEGDQRGQTRRKMSGIPSEADGAFYTVFFWRTEVKPWVRIVATRDRSKII